MSGSFLPAVSEGEILANAEPHDGKPVRYRPDSMLATFFKVFSDRNYADPGEAGNDVLLAVCKPHRDPNPSLPALPGIRHSGGYAASGVALSHASSLCTRLP